MKKYLILLGISISACGPLTPHIAVDAPEKPAVVQVQGQVNLSLNIDQITAIFKAQCVKDYPVPPNTQSDVDLCVNTELAAFLSLQHSTH